MLESGRYIADYQIVRPLAENQVYQTYLVKQPDAGSARLLLINPAQLPEPKNRQAFLDRARSLQEQTFPGICPLLDSGITEEGGFCLYQNPDGRALADLLNEPFSARRALELVQKIAAVLTAVHGSGLWHGHLSPATIFVANDSPALVELAWSSLVKLDFHSGADPRYSSPELVRGENIGAPADIYSLGILLYRLLMGAEPFVGDDPFAVAMQHVQGEIPRLAESHADYQSLLDAMLKGLPEERLAAGQLVEYLEQLLISPDIDRLYPPQPEPPVAEPIDRESALSKGDDVPRERAIEQLVSESEMSTRIAVRLKERAEVLQQSAKQSPDAERANTARIIAAGKQKDQIEQTMNKPYSQQKIDTGRFFILLILGVVIGVVLYLVFPGAGHSPQQEETGKGLPTAIVEGLTSGGKLLEQGDLDRAEQIFSALAKDYPTFPQPYNNLAVVYATQGDYDKARDYLERALATDASYATVYRNLGTIYAGMARDSYGKALQLGKGQQPINLQIFVAEGAKGLAVGGEAAAATAVPAEAPVVAVTEKTEPFGQEEASAAQPDKPVTEPPTAAEPAATEPAAAPGVEQQPQQTVATAPPQPEPETPKAFLQRWATAWSAQDVDAYLAFYGAEFIPADGRGREAWEKRRRSRLTRPASIKVALSDFAPLPQKGELLQIELTQDYQSDRYADRTRKKFELKQTADGWKIISEHSLGRVR